MKTLAVICAVVGAALILFSFFKFKPPKLDFEVLPEDDQSDEEDFHFLSGTVQTVFRFIGLAMIIMAAYLYFIVGGIS